MKSRANGYIVTFGASCTEILNCDLFLNATEIIIKIKPKKNQSADWKSSRTRKNEQ